MGGFYYEMEKENVVWVRGGTERGGQHELEDGCEPHRYD